MKLIIQTGIMIGLFTLIMGGVAVEAQAAGLPTQEMIIEVQPRVIALPGGGAGKNITKVPIRNARIRSTELRDLNAKFNAVSVERVYELAASGSQLISDAGKEKTLANLKGLKKDKLMETLKQEKVDISKDKILQVKDTFIITFSDYQNDAGQVIHIDLDNALAAYKALPQVISTNKN